jgi:hypothetical protein
LLRQQPSNLTQFSLVFHPYSHCMAIFINISHLVQYWIKLKIARGFRSEDTSRHSSGFKTLATTFNIIWRYELNYRWCGTQEMRNEMQNIRKILIRLLQFRWQDRAILKKTTITLSEINIRNKNYF